MRAKRTGRGLSKVFIGASGLIVLIVAVVISAVVLFDKNSDNHEQSSENNYKPLLIQEEFDTNPVEEEQQESEDLQIFDEGNTEEFDTNPIEEEHQESEDLQIPDEGNTEEEETLVEDTSPEEKLLSEMSLHDKICQMMLVAPETLTGVETATAASQTTQNAMMDYPVGGVILFAKNLQDRNQTVSMISNFQKYAKEYNGIGLFISVDEEGGRVARIAQKLGTTKLNPMYEYREQGTKVAYDNAVTLAKSLSQFGFNLDFAPVADIWSNSQNKVIGDRAYSDNCEKTAELVSSAVEGFHSENIMCTLKHFPGHGDTAEDSHTGSAYVYKTLDELRDNELLPFRAGIGAGADMVMAGHITVPEVDSLPASLSAVMITDILRGELAYDGVVITDSLSMEALTGYYGSDKIAVMAVQAGNDLLLCQSGMKNMVRALEDAVANGEITEERIDESVRRILKLKYKYGLLE